MRPFKLFSAMVLGGVFDAFVAAASMAGPPPVELAQVPCGRQSGCGSYVTYTLSTDGIDIC